MFVATMSESMRIAGTIPRCASIDLKSVQQRSKYARIFPEFSLGICIGVNFNRKLGSWTESWIGKYLYYDCYEIYRESSYVYTLSACDTQEYETKRKVYR